MSTITTFRRTSAAQQTLPQHKKNGVVDAVVINTPDLSFFLKLQNLLNYFVDCITNLTSSAENRALCAEHLDRCIGIMTAIDRTTVSIDDDLRRALDEFIEDAGKFRNLLAVFSEPQTAGTTDQSAAVLLSAKASHLQWLSVCILEDVKKNYRNG